ncbi:MAG: serine/threonine-protein kinase, partial [Candidatus Eisenbacteria bacterium]|nr:serine/threonine-protein kinase [Candidatus Eisenbacteria bacterium]
MAQGRTLLNGRFALGNAIGRGASGSVFRGLDTVTGESVAIKLLTAPGAGMDRLKSEAKLLQKLCHPCIVTVRGAGTEKETPFLVTDLVEGGSLRDLLIREHRLPITRALEIAIDLADALHHAHEHGIIHRDVKPANVLIASDGTPRLTDFGVAAVHDPAAVGLTRELIGTLAYLSPEGFRGEPRGPESDLWSLGLVLFEMLAGSLPFGDPATEAELPGLADRPAPLVSEFRPEAPDGLVTLLSAMLERDRSTRAGDAGEVARQIEGILKDLCGTGQTGSRRATATGAPGGSHTPFVGREHEHEVVLSLLKGRTHRLICLVGPGGIGKTRLARETVALAAEAFSDGVFLVPLASIPSAALMPPAIAAAVGLTFRGAAEPKVQLLEFLSTRRMLLVMDNVEHLLDGVGLFDDILDAAPAATLLVTSRERLGHPSEYAVELRGLGFPSLADDPDPDRYPALMVFEHAARRASEGVTPQPRDWVSIAAICRLVDGNPLGIELAAASVDQCPCQEIVTRVTEDIDLLAAQTPELPPRHRSMRAVFDHSWRLLPDSEQHMFRRMAVFHGGFTLEAARAVVGASRSMLSSLVRKSLLTRDGSDRYVLHELLRHYAREELGRWPHESGEVEDLHAEYYGRYVKDRESALGAARDKSAFLQIEAELPNLRRGWERAVAARKSDVVLMYLRGMHRFFEHQSRFKEGEAAFGDAVARLRKAPDADGPCLRALAVALTCWSAMIYRLARYQEARDLAHEARAMAE